MIFWQQWGRFLDFTEGHLAQASARQNVETPGEALKGGIFLRPECRPAEQLKRDPHAQGEKAGQKYGGPDHGSIWAKEAAAYCPLLVIIHPMR